MFADLGFHLLARGTARYPMERGLGVEEVLKGLRRPSNIVDRMINGDVALVINTASGKNTARDSKSIIVPRPSYGDNLTAPPWPVPRPRPSPSASAAKTRMWKACRNTTRGKRGGKI